MQIPFQLVRRTECEPATALLLLSLDPAQLLRLCTQLAADPLPRICVTTDGFLLLLDEPTDRPWPECLRLRRLAEHLLLPVDANLLPQLHETEAAALTRKRGLIFLPGERVLEFAPEFSVETADILSTGPVRREPWQTLPQRRFIAEQIRSITLELPPQPPETIVEEGGEGIGTEDPRPQDSSFTNKVAGRTQFGLGQALRKLGQALNWQGLKNMGKRWMESAMDAVPRLSEKVLGSQEAALRELLRRFRDGDVEGALKRALPLGEPGGRGKAAGDAILPTHNLGYSLGNILGGGGGGTAGIWYGGIDVQRELFREYRKAAEEAAARGDWKRAAFIYGKLLSDWREVAAVLSRGGLHHDAAIFYRDKLNDPLRAAVSFEAGGEFDEALKIYERLREHEKAGDLLRRLGEEEAAIERFLKAADALVERGKGPLAAGEFILRKTSRVDLAETYFASGWSLRYRSLELGNAVPCAVKLANIYSDREDAEAFFTLLQEGEDFFAPPGNNSAAGEFFNTMVRLSDQKIWDTDRDELRDRCLLALAGKIRHQAEHDRNVATLVSNLLGGTGLWEPAVVRDAAFAVRQPLPQPKPKQAERPATAVRLGNATVVAAVQAPGSGEVFVGFYNGELASFRASDSRVTLVHRFDNTIRGLAVDEGGDLIVVVVALEADEGQMLFALRRSGNGPYRLTAEKYYDEVEDQRLAPLIVRSGEDHMTTLRGVGDEQPLVVLRCSDLLPTTLRSVVFPDPACQDLLLPDPTSRESSAHWLVFESHLLHKMRSATQSGNYTTLPINWRPQTHPGTSLSAPILSWLRVEQDLWELAGIGEAGGIYYLRLRIDETVFASERLLATNCANGYRCTTLIRPGVLAGVTAENRLIWLRAEADRLKEFAPSQRLPTTNLATACFASRATGELLVILQDGSLLRMPTAK
jgi:tetratricopeptide (TPR) repeat protein